LFDYDNINRYEYNLFLCNVDKSIICTLDYLDISYTQNFRQYDELSFTVSENDNGWKQVKNQYFNYLQPLFLILMEVKNEDELIFQKYFIVDSPTFSEDSGIIKKNIKCYSLDYIFNNFYLNSYENVGVLYDTVGNTGILNIMLDIIENTWTISYISPTLLNIQHSYNFSSSTFRAVIESLEEQFNCFFIFDTVNNQINIYDASNEGYGESTNIVINDENYLKSLSADIKSAEMVTKLRVTGKDNISITKYNPLGLMILYDYTWARNNGRMSQSLSGAYDNWLQLIENNETTFQIYLSDLNALQTTLLTRQVELNDLNTALQVIEDSLDVLIDTYRRNNSSYNTIYNNKISVKGQITTKKNQITTLESQISTINTNILTLNNLLNIENNFTLSQRQELIRLTIEGNLKLDYVSDELQLYNYAKQWQVIKNKPSIDATINIIDLFSISDAYIESKYNKIKVGNYIYIDSSSLGFNYEPYRITQIVHSKLSNSLSITLSNKDRLNTEIYYLNRIFTPSSQAADDLKINKEDYSKFVQESNEILRNNSIIDVSTNEIIVGDNLINKRGFTGNSLGTRNGAIKIQGDQIVFSPDGDFADYYAILSADGLYLETENSKSRVVITPQYGIQIDKNVGTAESPNWDNNMYIDTDGNAIFAGTIRTLESALVGNNLIIGDLESNTKLIVFHSSGTNLAYIAFDNLNQLSLYNYGNITIDALGSMSLDTAGSFLLSALSVDISTTEGGLLKLGTATGRIFLNVGGGSNDIDIVNQGSGVIKIESAGNMSIESLSGTTFADGLWRFSQVFYRGSAIDDNKILTKSEVQALISSMIP
jgi:hypothetical protein